MHSRDSRYSRLHSRYSLAFIIAVLGLSWMYTAYLFADPQRVRYFPYVMYVPAICAVVLLAFEQRSIKVLMAPLRGKVNLQTLVASILLPVGTIAVCAVLALATGLAQFRAEKLSTITQVPSIGALASAVLLVFGEEYGWRGYLLPRLARSWGPIAATFAVGAIWALWHAPIVFGLAGLMGTGNPLLVTAIQACAVLVFSFPFAYLSLKSGSVFPPMIFHYVWNHFNPIVLGNIYRNQGGVLDGNILVINGEGVFGIVVGGLFVVWFVRHFRSPRSDPASFVTQAQSA